MPSDKTAQALYSDRPPRITKEDLFMVLALWMEHFPVESKEDLAKDKEDAKRHQKVGAVLVLPNDILYAVDCTRDGVHGVARLLMNHPDISKGCKVFVSRKPCSFCAKLLVQSKVERVFFPPFEPEYHGVRTSKEFEREKSQVDTLFTRSSIGQTVFLPKVEKPVLENVQKKHGATSTTSKENELFNKFWKENWMKTVNKNLPWPAFDDKMEAQAKKDFESTMKWMTQILVASELDAEEISFQKVKTKDQAKDQANDQANDEANDKAKGDKAKDNGKILNSKRATHLIKMARFLAERTDDPKRGVGAVIATDEEKEIKGLGWNGFPLKALYGEFPRASRTDQEVEDKKYPFVIHAEQNALLMRNDKKLGEDATLFVTKTPCDECVPSIQMQGIKTVVLVKQFDTDLGCATFGEKVEEGVFTCYVKQTQDQEKFDLPITPCKTSVVQSHKNKSQGVKRKLEKEEQE